MKPMLHILSSYVDKLLSAESCTMLVVVDPSDSNYVYSYTRTRCDAWAAFCSKLFTSTNFAARIGQSLNIGQIC